MREVELGESDLADKSSAAKRGRVRGAEFYVTGRIADVEYQESRQERQVSTPQGLRTEIVFLQIATVTVNVQVNSADTSTIVESIDASGRENTLSAVSLLGYWNQFVRGDVNVLSQIDLLNRAANKAVRQVAMKVNAASRRVEAAAASASANAAAAAMADARGTVLAAISADEIIVGLGSAVGLQSGDRVLVAAETVTRNSAGEVVYREEQALAFAEIAEPPQDASARARIVGRPEGAPRLPQEGDLVRVDVDATRSVRAGGLVSSSGPAGPSPGAVSSSNLRDTLREANRYFEDGSYSAAIDLYNEVLAVDPDNEEAVRRLFEGYVLNRDFLSAEEFAEQVVESGQTIGLPVIHIHSFGRCEGMLSIDPGHLLFHDEKRKHPFDADSSSLASLVVKELSLQGQRTSEFEIRYRKADGKEEKLSMVPTVYAKKAKSGLTTRFELEPADYEATGALTGLFERLVERFVR